MSDFIKRDDAIEAMENQFAAFMRTHKRRVTTGEKAIASDMIETAKMVKSADVAPIRHGHWIYDCCDIVCSECGTRYNDELCYMLRSDCSYHEPRYCLWCGARMDGDDDE